MVSFLIRQSSVKPQMRQVTDWLGKLGMSEYARRFADNDIDFSILGDLTDQDLEDLGVASLGHRRKISHALAVKILHTLQENGFLRSLKIDRAQKLSLPLLHGRDP